MIEKNSVVQLDISGMTDEGAGVGRVDGFTVFVPFALVGETVQVKIVKVLKSYGFGKLEQVLKPSPNRIEPDCGVFYQCGGCTFRHTTYEQELQYKYAFVKDTMQRLGGITVVPEKIVPSPGTTCYRNKAQYPLQLGEDGKVIAGFYARRSHRVVPCTRCPLQPEVFGDILEKIIGFLEQYKISIYNENLHQGLVRHVYLRLAEETGEVMVGLVLNGTALPHSGQFVQEILREFESVKTIVLNLNTGKTNVILSDRTIVLYGPGFIQDKLCGIDVKISPLSFYQVNRQSAENLYRIASELASVNEDTVLVDLYCGTGTIGLSMANQIKELIGVEIVPQAVEDARGNAQMNGIHNARFISADVNRAIHQLKMEGVTPDVILLDPPRKGCGEEIVDETKELAPARVVMVSCNPATLARDCKLFAPEYAVKKIVPVDMFPRTGHVEVVTLLEREEL